MQGRLTFRNQSVDATERSALGTLLRHARPKDYVVFKLDIDTPEVEKQIIDLFLSDEGRKYTDLIDEFFFEYQGSLTGGDPYDLDREGARVTEGILMMQRLRKMGIRAHSWV